MRDAVPTLLQQALPRPDFREHHSRWIGAEQTRVWEALTALSLDDLTVTRPLLAVRYLGRRPSAPRKTLFRDGPVRMLSITPMAYAVGGAVARPWQRHPPRREIDSLAAFGSFNEPGWVKYLVDFQLEPRDGGVRLTTETRGHCTDRWARQRMALYWSLIRPGSGLIRRDMLRAVARLALAER